MSDNDSKLEAINNGLKTIEFIQKNRDSIIKTYGRSAISDPKTKERTRAWEEFINNSSSHDGGSQRGAESSQGDQSSKSCVYPENDQEVLSRSPNTENYNNKTNDCGDNTGRDVGDVTGANEDRGSECGQRSSDNKGHQHPNPNGGTESAPSSQNDGGAPTRSGSEIGKRFNVEAIATTPGEPTDRTVKETTQVDLDEILKETEPMPPKRLKNSTKLNQISTSIKPDSPAVKKTTEGNSSSTKKKAKSPSRAGATQSAHQSDAGQITTNAAAENAQRNAINASTIHAEGNDLEDDEKRLNSMETLEKKIDQVLENQELILTKLMAMAEIKEEISGIKKALTNQSLAISTVEKYISEMMIVIPKSGQPDTIEGKDVNPDLRMVIGRDNTRGYKDMARKYNPNDKIDISDEIYIPREIDTDYILKDIDNNKNNAANFVPTNDHISYTIIKDIINKEVKMPEVAEELHQLVDESVGKVDARDLYNMILNMLN